MVRTGRQVKETVVSRPMALVELLETFGQLLVTCFITKLAPVIKNRLRNRVPDFVALRLTRKLAVIQRRDKFAMCEIARSTEDDDAAWLWHGPRGQSFAQRVWFRLIRRPIHSIRRLRDFRRLDNTS